MRKRRCSSSSIPLPSASSPPRSCWATIWRTAGMSVPKPPPCGKRRRPPAISSPPRVSPSMTTTPSAGTASPSPRCASSPRRRSTLPSAVLPASSRSGCSWTATPPSFPAASSSVSPSPVPLRRSPPFCSWMSPFPTSMPSCAWKCGTSCSVCTWKPAPPSSTSPMTRWRP